MSLLHDLRLVQNKEYVPLYSGRIKSSKTAKTTNNSFLKSLNRGKTRSDFRSAVTYGSSLRYADYDYDDKASEPSTNISLLTCDSHFNEERIDYGKIGHYSPFERYTNIKCYRNFYENRRFVAKYLGHYERLLNYGENKIFVEPGLYDLFEKGELEKLIELEEVEKVKPKSFRAHSVACQKKIIYLERKFLYKNPNTKVNKKQNKRRHSIPNKIYKLPISFLAKDEVKSQVKFGLNFNDNSYSTFKATNIKSPREYNIKIGYDKIEPTNVQSRPRTSLSRSTKNEYASVESKLKPYIRPNTSMLELKKPSMTTLIKKLSKDAINLYTKTTADRQETKSNLVINRNLDRLIEKEKILEKGPVYFVALTKDNVKKFDSTRKPVRQEKNLHLFEWLQEMDSISFSNDTCVDFADIKDDTRSLDAHIDSHNFLGSYSNIQTNSFVTGAASIRTPSPNIYLPHFVFNNPNKPPKAEPHLNINETIVKRIVSEYKRNHLKIDVNYRPYGNDNYSATTRRALSAYSTADPRLLIKEKLRKEELKHDLLLTRMKLDLYVL